jgi:hypothetical protein
MNKFREGMKVVCVKVWKDYHTDPVIGRIYEVVSHGGTDKWFRLECKTTGNHSYYLKEDFVPYEKKKMIEEILK